MPDLKQLYLVANAGLLRILSFAETPPAEEVSCLFDRAARVTVPGHVEISLAWDPLLILYIQQEGPPRQLLTLILATRQ